jgi:hypothetical protein
MYDPLADVTADVMTKPKRRSQYLSAKDVKDGPLTFGVTGAIFEDFKPRKGEPAQRKLVLQLEGDAPNRLALNQTNRLALADAWGRDARQWAGKAFDAYFDPTVESPDGAKTGGLRVKPRYIPTQVIATATEAADDLDF